jgi:uncharacterized membrane protein
MAIASYPEVAVGFLLVFFVPGYALTKATFPEWRIRGPEAPLRLIETFSLALILSVALTVLVGYALLAAAPGGFQAYWTDPVLEAVLAGVAAIAFVAGWTQGAYRREPPATRPEEPGESGAWEVSRELERIGREERRIAHQLRVRADDPVESERLRADLGRLAAEKAELQRRREAEYAT